MTQTVTPTLNTDSHLKTPPSPRGHWLLGHVRDMQHDTLNFLSRLAHEYGDVARIRFLAKPLYVVSHPDGTRQILQKNHLNYDRSSFYHDLLRPFLGNSLPLSDGALWQRQRHLMQPAFHKQRITNAATQMVKAGDVLLKHWEGRTNQDEPLDIYKDMTRLTLSVVGMILFGLDLVAENPMGQAFKTLVPAIADYTFLPFPPLSVPTPRNRRIQSTVHTLNMLVYDLIRERREQKTDTGDLLSLLLASEEDGSDMSEQQLRDEVVALFFAGYETSANALTWALYEISQHPEVEHRLWEEINTVLHGKPPTVADLSQLPYVRMVIDETLRLYPPAMVLARRALADDNICEYRIPANALVMPNIYASHHHPEYWEEPEAFVPDRFSPDHPCKGVHTAYFPFGGGPHICLGNNFALMEAQILLTMMVQHYQFQLAPGQTVEPIQKLTLRPGDNLLMFLKART